MASPEDRPVIFRRLYEAHYRPVAAYARRRVSLQDADDVVADTFMVAWRRLADVPDGDGALPWLFGVARRVISQRLRSARRRDRLLARLIRFGRLDDVSIQESAGFDERESVHQALAMLRPEDQELLRLSEWEEMAPGDLAVIYECSTNAVTIRLHRARRRLGQALQAVDVDTDSTTPGPPVARPERSP